jgi:hypothetical protein
MDIINKLGRFWTVLLPALLLVAIFQYAHHINSIINSIGGMGFKKTLVIVFISFLAIWSLLYLGGVVFIIFINWIWCGTAPIPFTDQKTLDEIIQDQPIKDNIEFHNEIEQENLFRLDLQEEPVDKIRKP